MDYQTTENVGKEEEYRQVKMKKSSRCRTQNTSQPTVQQQPLPTANRFEVLAGPSNQDEATAEAPQKATPQHKTLKIPPIVIYNCTNHVKLCRELKEHLRSTSRGVHR